MVTAFYQHGSAKSLNRLLKQPRLSQYNNIQTRFQMCIDYVTIMNFLHHSPIGVRVMCDTATVAKTLSQYLITDDFRLVVNDLDNLPEVDQKAGKLVVCTRLRETRLSVAPEQRWPYSSKPFKMDLMPPYDEKIDIWKIPGVFQHLLGQVDGRDFVLSQLRGIMEQCRALDPTQRPTVEEVLQKLLEVQQIMREARELNS